jgi:phage terminase large subunit-like protein
VASTDLTTLIPPEGWEKVATPAERERYLELVRIVSREWKPLPHQVMPSLDEDWDIWAMVGGRGIGKTDGGAMALDKLLRANPGWRARIIAPTLDDAKEACVDGPSGLKAHNPTLRVNYNDHTVLWPNGSRARWYGMDKPDSADRLRAGGNVHLDWFEELAAQTHAEAGWVQADLGRRLGRHPRVIVTTTPKNRPMMRWLLGMKITDAVRERFPWMKLPARARITSATTDENPHLEPEKRALFYATYGGTRLGEQELMGRVLEDLEGALWKSEWIDADRVVKPLQKRWLEDNEWKYADDLSRVVVAVDPTGTKGGDEVGIVAAGLCPQDGHGYVLRDASGGGMSPEAWGRRVIQTYVDLQADEIVAEVNFGGDMVGAVVRQAARDMEVAIKFDTVTASRGKRVRAEPVAQLYEQHRVHHCGTLAQLEEELTTWDPDETTWSPNRLDALVWALHRIMPATGRQRLRFHAD